MHWHKEAEWAYMIAGRARITAVDAGGAQLHRRRRRGRPVELPGRHPALDPGAGGGLRVPARVRRRQLLGERDLPDHATGSRTHRPTCSPRTSACPRRPSRTSRPTSSTRATSSQGRCRARSRRTPWTRPPARCPSRSATDSSARSRSRLRAARFASSTRRTFRQQARSPRRWWRSSRARCASCTGTRTPTSGSTTSRGRGA